jgi:hypothetical protein
MTRLSTFGKDLHTRIRTFFDSPLGPDATPLEVCQAVLDEVERQVQPVRRGQRVFPFTLVIVRVTVAPAARAAMTTAFTDVPSRIRERLAELRCDPPRMLDVQLECLDEAPSSWGPSQVYDVQYVAEATPVPPPATDVHSASVAPTLQIVVLRGAAAEADWQFTGTTVAIGRSADPMDDAGRSRRNRVAFLDVVDGVTETVGRAHARLTCDPRTGEVRLFDEGSRNGTAVLRGGEEIAVHRRDPRGVRVRSGDEIRLGRALLRVDFVG